MKLGRLEKPVSQRPRLLGLKKALETLPGQPQGIAVRSRQSGAEWHACQGSLPRLGKRYLHDHGVPSRKLHAAGDELAQRALMPQGPAGVVPPSPQAAVCRDGC